jgi:ketol-acid reductoisomerase
VIDDHVRDNMRRLLRDIQDRTFANEWIEQMGEGEPRLKELRARAADERIEVVGRELRGLMKREVHGVR